MGGIDGLLVYWTDLGGDSCRFATHLSFAEVGHPTKVRRLESRRSQWGANRRRAFGILAGYVTFSAEFQLNVAGNTCEKIRHKSCKAKIHPPLIRGQHR